MEEIVDNLLTKFAVENFDTWYNRAVTIVFGPHKIHE